jgi:hypothetical protein
MLRIIRSRLTFANVVASLALFIAIGGTSYAALKLPAGSVGTKQIRNKAVTLGKISSTARTALTGRTGPVGPAGPAGLAGAAGAAGATGAAGAPATKLWALVSSAGAVVRSSGGVNATRPFTGDYIVEFPQDVNSCAYVVTPGRLLPNVIAVVDGKDDGATSFADTNAKVEVDIGDNAGTPVNNKFFIAVVC